MRMRRLLNDWLNLLKLLLLFSPKRKQRLTRFPDHQ
jgi:hypothetical protein